MSHVLAQDLRNAVLQAAIQGKLTSHLSSDSDVYELINAAEKEKIILIKEKIIKKEKPQAPISEDEVLYDLPDNWATVRLGDYIFIRSGDGLTSSKYIKGPYPVYGGNGINGYHNAYNVPKGTLVIGRVGFYCGSIHETIDNAWVTDNALIVTFLSCFSKPYLKLLLTALDLGKNTNQTAQPLVTGKIIKPKIAPLPPIEEQARIVARVDELMAKIDEYEKIEKNLTELQKAFPGNMKDAILQAAMQGKLTKQLDSDSKTNQLYSENCFDDDLPFDIPDNWTWTTLNSLIKKDNIGDGDWVLSNDMCAQSNNNLVQIGSVGDGRYIDKDFKHVSDEFFDAKNCSELFKEDILVSRFISKEHMNVCILPDLPGRLFTAVDVCWIRNDPDRYSNKWLMWCLLSQGVQRQVMLYTAGTTRQRVSKTNLMKVHIPLPPIEEQQRIVDKLDQLLPLCESLESMI